MTTTYKLLQQYYLDRDNTTTTTEGAGYYYGGSGESTTTYNNSFNDVYSEMELDQRFNFEVNNELYNTVRTHLEKLLTVYNDQIVKLNSDGSLDEDFSPITGRSISLIDSKDRIYAKYGQQDAVSRYNPDGTLDRTFKQQSISNFYGIKEEEDGSLLFIGTIAQNKYINRVSENGNQDLDFLSNATFNEQVYTALPLSDGILIGGNFTTVNGYSRNRLTMLNNDGTISNINDFQNFGTNSYVSSILKQSDGKILIIGGFTTVTDITGSTHNRNLIARLNSDLTLDTSYDLNLIGDSINIFSYQLQEDDKLILAAKGVTSYKDGVSPTILTRFDESGLIDFQFPLYPNQLPTPIDNLLGFSITTFKNKNVAVSFRGASAKYIFVYKEKVENAPYQLVYTVPSSTSVILGSIFSTNHNDFPVYYDIAVVPYEDSTISEKHHLVYDNLLESNGFDLLKDKITLSAGDKIYVYSSSDEKISFNIFGTEITA